MEKYHETSVIPKLWIEENTESVILSKIGRNVYLDRCNALKAFAEFNITTEDIYEDLVDLIQIVIKAFPDQDKVSQDKIIHDKLIDKLPDVYTKKIFDEHKRRHNLKVYDKIIVEEFIGDELYIKLLEWNDAVLKDRATDFSRVYQNKKWLQNL